MRKRETHMLAILLSVAMVFTMNMPLAAAGAENEPEAGDEQSGAVSTNLVSPASYDLGGGWTCTTSDTNSATVSMVDGKCMINAKRVTGSEAKDIGLSFNGHIGSSDLFIRTGDYCVYESGKNHIAINVSSNRSELNGYFELNIYIQNDRLSHSYGIDESVLSFDIADGFDVKRYENIDSIKERHETIDGIRYDVYSIINMTDNNRPSVSVDKEIGDYGISYYTRIPYFGKKAVVGGGKLIFGDFYIYDKDGNRYVLSKVKVVRLKNTSPQGAYPTITNAGIQIQKVEWDGSYYNKNLNSFVSLKDEKRFAKKVSRDLKKLTKVKSKDSPENLQLPVVIFPYRLEYVQEFKNKGGKCSFKFTPLAQKKYVAIKSGKKDSFKNKYQVDYDGTYLTVSSADVWSGPKGLSRNNGVF